jgi:hypothetical protein
MRIEKLASRLTAQALKIASTSTLLNQIQFRQTLFCRYFSGFMAVPFETVQQHIILAMLWHIQKR